MKLNSLTHQPFSALLVSLCSFGAVVFTACQNPIPNQFATSNNTSSPPSLISDASEVNSDVSTSARFFIPVEQLQSLSASDTDNSPLQTTLRFHVERIGESSDQGEISTQWSFPSQVIRQRTHPLILETSFLKPGDNYRFMVEYVSDSMDCTALVARDVQSIYPLQADPVSVGSVAPVDSSVSTDLLNLDFGDVAALSFPIPPHGQVRFPDGRVASGVKVNLQTTDGVEVVVTNAQGYYVGGPTYNGKYAPETQITVPALSDQSVFQNYSAIVNIDYAPRSQCNEALSRHDIQLLAG